MTDVDLGFNPLQPRARNGEWVHGAKGLRALQKADPGSVYEAKEGTFTKRMDGNWQSTTDDAFTSLQAMQRASRGELLSPPQQRRRKDQMMNTRDQNALARKHKTDLAKAVRNEVVDLSHTGEEIDLDWTEWNKNHGKGTTGQPMKKGLNRRPAAGNKRAQSEIERFKESAGLDSSNSKLGPAAMAVLRRRAKMGGHLRAKAILAAARGNTGRANKIEAARKVKSIARRATTSTRKAGMNRAGGL